MFKEFKKFAVKGNVIDMAVGIVIGVAFGAIVASFVADVLMPPIGLLLGNIDFSNLFLVLKDTAGAGPFATLAAAREAGAVTLNYGLFINTVISFLIIGFSIFMVVKWVNKLKVKDEEAPAEPTTKECPYCFSTIAIKAVRCPACTSALKE
ncbi:MAG: large-conductance mechanosensitive channel protein MscL [Candidatus Aminicenantes bacterium]|nr:large-conductance mechanosensitive channel protein MscL [Candidatus Aminicenantes bacterium]